MNNTLTIPIKPVSVKNCKTCFKGRVAYTKRARDFKKNLNLLLKEEDIKEWFKSNWDNSFPMLLGIHYIHPDKRVRDWINLCQGVVDCLKQSNIIPDDDEVHLVTLPYRINNNWFTYDKGKVGIIFKIFKNESICL